MDNNEIKSFGKRLNEMIIQLTEVTVKADRNTEDIRQLSKTVNSMLWKVALLVTIPSILSVATGLVILIKKGG